VVAGLYARAIWLKSKIEFQEEFADALDSLDTYLGETVELAQFFDRFGSQRAKRDMERLYRTEIQLTMLLVPISRRSFAGRIREWSKIRRLANRTLADLECPPSHMCGYQCQISSV
jgi:hypothetical protein